MRTRSLLPIPLALFALLLMASAAFAGGWAAVTMTDPPSDITPGEETTVDMTVLQHGETPVDWAKMTVVATNADTGRTLRADARPVAGKIGLYRATLAFPTDGNWAITYESPELVMDGTTTLAVVAPPPVTAPATTATPAAEAAPANYLLPFALVVGTIVVLGLLAAFLIGRRPEANEQHEQPVASRG